MILNKILTFQSISNDRYHYIYIIFSNISYVYNSVCS